MVNFNDNNLTHFQGRRILDLGSGGRINILLAASKVGVTGQAIGLDIFGMSITLVGESVTPDSLLPFTGHDIPCST